MAPMPPLAMPMPLMPQVCLFFCNNIILFSSVTDNQYDTYQQELGDMPPGAQVASTDDKTIAF
jgi:hypothetical protein